MSQNEKNQQNYLFSFNLKAKRLICLVTNSSVWSVWTVLLHLCTISRFVSCLRWAIKI